MVAAAAMISIAGAVQAQGEGNPDSQGRNLRVSDDNRQQFRERIREEREARGRALSPEERREIRRDIIQHGRDVYGDRPGGPGPRGPQPPGQRGGKGKQ